MNCIKYVKSIGIICKKIIYKIMEYGVTAHNRTVYALPPVGGKA
jgi:hypothetical protein